jgi:uroporphyrinogen III methyltransferase / synthase
LRAPERGAGAGRVQGAGRVHLVGAGPGDPGLLTARALELIARADTILYDRLIPARALEGAREDAELVFVGKQGSGASVPQEHTQALMVEHARAGREVVRLKGGDPFVFGRGGEEALALRDAGIEFDVVPGVTAGVAAAAYAGIPVTHRGVSTGVALVTGHTEDGEDGGPELDWRALAVFPGTLVFYMGVRQLERIAKELIDAGRPAEQPVALVERGTLPVQRAVYGTLATIARVAERERVRAPTITVVGEVAALAGQLEWLAPGPLAGRTVAVTRARTQASELAQRLEELGASVVQAPAIRTRSLPGPPLDPSGYDLVCLTSPNAVEYMFERLAAGGRDTRSLAGARVAAIGVATAKALGKHGILADVIPPKAVGEALGEALDGTPARRALVPRASGASDVLPDALRARGTEVDTVNLYETVPEPLPKPTIEAALAADYVTFTSSSTVENFLAVLPGGLSPSTRIVSIGPVTSGTLREHGLEPHVEAEQHDVGGVVQALLDDATRER